MYQTIDERIAVIGIFDKHTFTPKKFKWKDKEYKVEKITMITDSKNGGIPFRGYSVLSQGTLFRLEFNRETEVWRIMEIWVE